MTMLGQIEPNPYGNDVNIERRKALFAQAGFPVDNDETRWHLIPRPTIFQRTNITEEDYLNHLEKFLNGKLICPNSGKHYEQPYTDCVLVSWHSNFGGDTVADDEAGLPHRNFDVEEAELLFFYENGIPAWFWAECLNLSFKEMFCHIWHLHDGKVREYFLCPDSEDDIECPDIAKMIRKRFEKE